MAFAIAAGNFSDGAIWDTGVAPTGSENAYANNVTIQVDTSISLAALRNDANPYYLPNTAIPLMTSATSPSGGVSQSTQVTGLEAFRAFDRNTATFWQVTAGVTSGTITYKFPDGSPKTIKKYYWRASGTATTTPRNFSFEASNDPAFVIGVATLESRTNINVGANGTYAASVINSTAYLYYRLNVTTTNGGTLQIAEIEMTESTSNIVGQLTGSGSFVLSTANTTVSINSLGAVGSNLIIANATSGTTTLNIAAVGGITGVAVGNLINHSGNCNLTIITPSVTGGQSSSGVNCIVKSGLGTLTIGSSGNPTIIRGGGSNGGANNNGISSNNGNIIINGNILAPTSANASACHAISQSVGTLTIVGDVTGGTTVGHAINSSSGGTLEISGIVIGGSTLAAINKTGGAIDITGSVEARNTQAIIGTPTSILVTGNVGSYPVPSGLVSAIAITNTAVIEVGGYIAANSTSPGITSLGLVKLTGVAYNVNKFRAVYAPQITIEATTTSWEYQTFSGSPASITLYASGASLGNPALADVRFGTAYGPSNTLIGTMRVQTAPNVLQGTLVDNVTGTLIMTPDGFIEELGVNTRPIAVRLQNCATVETTGDQVATYNV